VQQLYVEGYGKPGPPLVTPWRVRKGRVTERNGRSLVRYHGFRSDVHQGVSSAAVAFMFAVFETVFINENHFCFPGRLGFQEQRHQGLAVRTGSSLQGKLVWLDSDGSLAGCVRFWFP